MMKPRLNYKQQDEQVVTQPRDDEAKIELQATKQDGTDTVIIVECVIKHQPQASSMMEAQW